MVLYLPGYLSGKQDECQVRCNVAVENPSHEKRRFADKIYVRIQRDCSFVQCQHYGS